MIGGRRAHEFDRVVLQIGMRQAAGIFRNAAIVGEMRNRFYVRERRPAQRQPFGLEDAATRLAQRRGRDVLQHVGLLDVERNAIAHEMEKGEAGFPPPLGALFELRRFNRTRRNSMLSTVYSAASVIGTTDTKVRPLAFARNST